MTEQEQETEKMELFEQEIMRRAEAERDEILAETERMKAEELDREKDRLLEQQYRAIQAETERVKAENVREVSRETISLKKELYRQREQYLGQLIAQARAELSAFAQSDRYPAFFLGKIETLAREYPFADSIIRVREQDRCFEKQIQEIYKDCIVETGDTVILGGAILLNAAQGIEVDLSLDTALMQQREWFYRNSNFNFE